MTPFSRESGVPKLVLPNANPTPNATVRLVAVQGNRAVPTPTLSIMVGRLA